MKKAIILLVVVVGSMLASPAHASDAFEWSNSLQMKTFTSTNNANLTGLAIEQVSQDVETKVNSWLNKNSVRVFERRINMATSGNWLVVTVTIFYKEQ